MGILDTFSRILDKLEGERQILREQALTRLAGDIAGFPVMLLDEPEVPVHKPCYGEPFPVFPLGEFRVVSFDHISGRTTLYIGPDGRLYEYGPAIVSASESTPLTQDNAMCLRSLNLDTLSYGALAQGSELLRRIWVL